MSRHLKLPTILIVADNPAVSLWVKKNLEEQFFVLVAENRREALDALYSSLDFIIIDSEFEHSDPLELSKEIHSQTAKSGTPIFLITGKLKKSYREKAKKAGITEFLSANLDLDELLIRIEVGKKAAAVRQKTEDVTRSIKMPSFTNSNASLKNKFVLNDKAVRLLAAAKKEKTPVALLLMRIDTFDAVADQPQLLKSFSKFINLLLRKNDVLIPASEGGFILLLSNTTPQNAKTIAERLREKIRHHTFEGSSITVSIAVTSLEASQESFHRMLDSATKSLKTRESTNLIISLDQETE